MDIESLVYKTGRKSAPPKDKLTSAQIHSARTASGFTAAVKAQMNASAGSSIYSSDLKSLDLLATRISDAKGKKKVSGACACCGRLVLGMYL